MIKKLPSAKIILLACMTLSVLVIVPSIPKSYEHAFVIGSDPAPFASLNSPPSQVEVTFVDPIDITHSQISVLDANGKAVNNNDWHYSTDDHKNTVVTLPAIPNGIYTVNTKVLDATDGHTTKNAFVFAVGEPIPANLLSTKESVSFTDIVSIQDTLARYPSLLGQIIVVGALFSTFWLWKPVSKISSLKSAFEQTRVQVDKKMTWIVLLGSIIILGGDAAMISAAAYSINAGLIEAVSTTFGNLWLIRLVSSLALFGVALIAYRKQKQSNTVLPKSLVAALFGIGTVVLATTTLISHGAASGQILPPVLDFAHNVVASLWIGSVIYLAFVVMPKLKQIQDGNLGTSVLSIIIPRFSSIVVALLGIVILTGPTLLYALENNLSLTLASIYGEILIIKLALAGAMIGLGAFNQSIVHRKALNSITNSQDTSGGAMPAGYNNAQNKKSVLSQFDKSIKIEAMIGFVLIASIATLVDSGLPGIQFQDELTQQQQQIPHVFAFSTPLASQNQFSETGFTDIGDKIVMSIDPFYTGENNITLSFYDSKNNLIQDVNSTRMTFNQVDRGIGPIEVDNAKKISPGVFSADTNVLAMPGHWQAQVEGIITTAGALDAVTTFDNIYVAPNLNQLQANITEYKFPDSKAQPLYPMYDNIRDVVWVGDSAIGSGRMFEFDPNTKQFTEHKIDGTSIITFTIMDFQNNIWYVDPISKILGVYEPESGKSQNYKIPSNTTISGIAIDNSGNLWMTSASTSQLLKFDTTAKSFHSIDLPADSIPLGISIDESTNEIWVAESNSGKIANVDPAQNYKITEYSPFNGTLSSPTTILFDPVTSQVFVSEHDGQAVSTFDPLLKTFKRYNTDKNGLPFGMVFDTNHNLWLAQHTLDKIAIIDPQTGKTNEFDIPTNKSFTQWITADPKGNIILAEQHGNALGVLTTSIKPGFIANTEETSAELGVPLGFNYADAAGPSITAGLIAVAFFYSKSVIDLKNSTKQVRMRYPQ